MDRFEVRLDADVWRPTALGTVGPRQMLGEVAVGGASYRPLLTHHLRDGPLANGLDRAVELAESPDDLRAVLASPVVTPWRHHEWTIDDEAWARDDKVAVVMRERRGGGFNGLLVAGLDRGDEHIAHASTFWVPNALWLRAAGAEDILAAGWLALFRALAERGAVGVRTTEEWSGAAYVDVLRRIAGFRPLAEHYAALGISPADSAVVLVEWRATIDEGRLARFATRPELDEAAHTELIRQLDAYVNGLLPPPTEPPGPPLAGERLTFQGDIGLDGVRGWGTGPEPGGWFDAPPDHVPDGTEWNDVNARALAALGEWLRHERGAGGEP